MNTAGKCSEDVRLSRITQIVNPVTVIIGVGVVTDAVTIAVGPFGVVQREGIDVVIEAVVVVIQIAVVDFTITIGVGQGDPVEVRAARITTVACVCIGPHQHMVAIDRDAVAEAPPIHAIIWEELVLLAPGTVVIVHEDVGTA